MINLILNEKNYAEELICGEAKESNAYYALSLLAKYYYQKNGFTKKKIIMLLKKYADDNYVFDEAEKVKLDDAIEKMVSNAKKYKLHEIDGISITENEMKVVDSVSGSALRRLAFTVLCLAKLGNLRNPKNDNWVNVNSKDVFKLANITCSAYEREVKIGLLYNEGLLEFAKRNDNLSYRVKYVDADGSDEVMFIDDLRELGYQYINYHDGGFVRCCECGVWMRDNNAERTVGRPKNAYCKNCVAPSAADSVKIVQCQDCGCLFTVSIKNHRTSRCPYCYKEYRREYRKLYMRNDRNVGNL